MATAAGVILGTAVYMAPEQAKGQPADRRADMWAFGCVLYEMLTGQPTFSGEDVTEVLAAVLRGEPGCSALPKATPPAIETLIRRCLKRIHASVSRTRPPRAWTWTMRSRVAPARQRTNRARDEGCTCRSS